MNKTELIAAIAEDAETTKANAEKVLNSFFKVVPADLAAHKDEENYKVQIMGFGTYKTSFVEGREGVNPKNRDEIVQIPDSFRVHFSAGQNFKEVVNGVVKTAKKISSTKAGKPIVTGKKKKKNK